MKRPAINKRAQRAHPMMTKCERCGTTEGLTRHHPDYSEPERIEILCYGCHAKADRELGLRRRKKPKLCGICGRTFTNYSHSRVKNCSPQCLSEAGRRNALKRWGDGGRSSHQSGESPAESRTEWTALPPSETP
jgi:hypothetical protein